MGWRRGEALLVYSLQQSVNLWFKGLLAIVHYAELAALHHLFLRQLVVYPCQGLLSANAIAGHDASYAHLKRSCYAYHMGEGYALVELAVEEDGALEPCVSRLHKVGRHGGVHHIVYGLLVGLALQQIL